jgi:GDPmannose 4,6-dehydratase
LYNHEGPRRGEEFVTRKITKSVARIRKAINDNCLFAELELGNIHSTRDWSYAEDVVKGIWLMVNNTSPNDFVLASGEVHSIKEFVQIAFECAGLEGKWLGNGLEEVFQSVDSGRILVRINPKFYRPLEVGALVGDSSRARTILGWQPSVSFHQMVDKMVEFDLKRVGL